MAVFSFLLVSMLFLPAFLPPSGTFNDVELSITLTNSSKSDSDLPTSNNAPSAPSSAKQAMYDLIDTLSDEQTAQLLELAKSALSR